MRLLLLLSCLFIQACSITPQIISPHKDPTKTEPQRIVVKDGGWGWILWYAPVAVIAVIWGYREIFKKKEKKD
jgi:hypothetical protein